MSEHLDERRPGFWHLLPVYVACYALWIGLAALGVWTLLQMRNALLGLLPIVGPWIMGAVDKFGFFFLGVAWLAWIIYLEHYLRTGVEEGLLARRALRVTAIQVALLAAAYGFQVLPMLF